MSERIITAEERNEDKEFEWSLRPKRLAEFIGQETVKAQLEILITAARGRNEPIEHILIAGPPGLGKTTLANIMANEMGVNIRTTSGPAIEHQGALASILTNLEDRDIFFVDEIHRLARPVEESLYPAMEDFKFDFVSGKGAGAQTFRLQLPRFTVGPAARPLRRRLSAVFLWCRGAVRHRHPFRAAAQGIDRRRRGAHDRQPRPRHTARRQPAAAAGAGLRPGAGAGKHR